MGSNSLSSSSGGGPGGAPWGAPGGGGRITGSMMFFNNFLLLFDVCKCKNVSNL
jgi:hypothetical protein